MGLGTNNEFIIFPILDLIKKELRSYEDIKSHTAPVITPSRYSDILEGLESPDYELTLNRENDMLSNVVIDYSNGARLVLDLIREADSLVQVMSSILTRRNVENISGNPYFMTSFDFYNYVKYKVELDYYNNHIAEGGGVDEELITRVEGLTLDIGSLNSRYGVTLSMLVDTQELLTYLPNIEFTIEEIQESYLVNVISTDKGHDVDTPYSLLIRIVICLHYKGEQLSKVTSRVEGGGG